jgi:hypothetical protein
MKRKKKNEVEKKRGLFSPRSSTASHSLFLNCCFSLLLTVDATDPGWSATVSQGMTSRRSLLEEEEEAGRRRRCGCFSIGAAGAAVVMPSSSPAFNAPSAEAAKLAVVSSKDTTKTSSTQPRIRSIWSEGGKAKEGRGGRPFSFFFPFARRRSVDAPARGPSASFSLSLSLREHDSAFPSPRLLSTKKIRSR